ncbi:MAG TPA: hypothetical protein VE934_15230 [Polaromonas sp.]|uniref:hypothetical protein n=1 Tax=Polaromonas sp. TaxID=1869339 RepID=UPI002D3440E2|nr:hypothetical protein [Polaromonas sp.]HYW58307.1 hypothetical protein [Polaromonas sp.]
MFSNHLPRVNSVPREYIHLGAAVLVLLVMLTGLASVANGQVRKAELRESLLASQKTAIAYCMESKRGAELNSCIQLAKADSEGAQTSVVVANTAGFSRSAMAPSSVQGFVPASFSTHR